MSADNGIYILKTAGPEFRVAHLQSIDNLYLDDNGRRITDFSALAENARKMFGRQIIVKDETRAFKVARVLANKVRHDFGFLEYGIQLIDFSFLNLNENLLTPPTSTKNSQVEILEAEKKALKQLVGTYQKDLEILSCQVRLMHDTLEKVRSMTNDQSLKSLIDLTLAQIKSSNSFVGLG